MGKKKRTRQRHLVEDAEVVAVKPITLWEVGKEATPEEIARYNRAVEGLCKARAGSVAGRREALV